MLRLLTLVAVIAAVSPTRAADLSVTLAEIRDDRGYVLAAVYDSPQAYPKDASAVAKVKIKARAGRIGFVISGLPAGQYVVSAFHDENSNEKLDTGVFGVPTEGYGFSNDARGLFGPPSFDAAAITLREPGEKVTVTLRY